MPKNKKLSSFPLSLFSTRSGFTLIEIIVVTAVVMMLSTVLIVYSSTSRQQIAAFVEQVKIAQLILRAKSLALSTYSQSGVACAYGFRIDYSANTYELVGYDIPNSAYPNGHTNCDKDILIFKDNLDTVGGSGNTYTINPNLKFTYDNNDSLDYVLFFPPNPDTVLVHGPGIVTSQVWIHIITLDGSLKKDISVNPSGQVSF